MRNWEKSLESVIACLRAMTDAGGVESGQMEVAAKVVEELRHALIVQDLPRIRALVSYLAKLFTRSV